MKLSYEALGYQLKAIIFFGFWLFIYTALSIFTFIDNKGFISFMVSIVMTCFITLYIDKKAKIYKNKVLK
ncbi:Uncharacterised protein [Yersinia enterocolitica]|uniref:Uncharacterized protein n=1 Tax=Proteus terrae subsp. cibarius TaxID=626774 RepID=A0ABX6JSY2_9GAMM|nr:MULTISPECIES: hypothetical protein [Enterobacterales]MBU5964455.1 hypothetical protein [Proteus mirabilis]QGW05280.1 hypothetical protein F9282_19985 [Proteus terrae subsp. cibarius]QHD96447.1 hypothetical protein GSM99_18790 [Proteus terrae subsp. cibarius]QIF92312.1 hypothetical protein GTH23_19915 [Proteus terrae subsp. cibarius]QJW53117.1 hypothetical protein HND96_19700 [Proteus terrae subsp. cibarius]